MENAYGIDCISNQWNLMCSWIPDDINQIYYFEDIPNIITDIGKQIYTELNMEASTKHTHINKSQHAKYMDYYDIKPRNKIYELYKEDFIRFKYGSSLNRESNF